ncbi:MAG: D-2-hydroxyacid dehydrogenase [Myxococcota bacterium]
MPPKITVLDGHTLNPGDNPWDPVAAHGDLTVHDITAPDQILERAQGADILLTNKTPLDADTLAELDGLRFISVLATGYDVVDVDAAARRGIPVSNVPEYGTDSVAQHVFALLLELTNHVAAHDQAVRDGDWADADEFAFWKHPVVELADKTLGIVGFGKIGRRTAEIAHAFGMRVVANSRSEEDPAPWFDFEFLSKDELFAQSDVVSLHCPLTEETRHVVDARRLELMKESAFLINTARGQLIDSPALADALADEQLAGAAVDVVEEEPIPDDHPLLRAPGCLITSHMAWASVEARRRLMQTTADNIAAYLEGSPQNVVNPLEA